MPRRFAFRRRRYARKGRFSSRARAAAIRRRPSARRFGSRRSFRFSRRRILNVASIKKHDNMMPTVRIPGGGLVPGPISTTTGFTSLFVPSARQLNVGSAGESGRERQTTFSVGYKERVQVDVIGGGVWKWRRVVFAYKGVTLYDQGDPTWTVPFHNKAIDPQGSDMVRLIGQPTTDQAQFLRAVIWDGTEGIDWTSEFVAKVDTSRVTPLYDRTITFNPRNESGYSRTFRLWHPTRKNIVYNEDEEGGAPDAFGSYTSVIGRPGMGDLYVYDIVYNVIPSASGSTTLNFTPEGTYYWHER
uniref:Capsid protein n=1 Tax=Genomoviridae sp. TaxID=2202565 RepID=A0A8F5ML24_9VIRU|nr:MAG: capsid protein [Genomoviridae sp.]